MRLRLAESRLVREPPCDGPARARRLRLHERDVPSVLRFLPVELRQDGAGTAPLGSEQPDEDLVPQRRGPARPAGEPRPECLLSARRHAENAPQARPGFDVAPGDQAAVLELVEQLVDLADVSRVCRKAMILKPFFPRAIRFCCRLLPQAFEAGVQPNLAAFFTDTASLSLSTCRPCGESQRP
jgi:hypothetical protein